MLILRLIFKNTFRHKLRTSLTILVIAISVLAFSVLRTMVSAWYSGVELSSADRLVTRNAISLGFTMPASYKKQISRIKGVKLTSYANWFEGIYLDEKNFFVKFAVDPESYFELHPEYVVPPEHLSAFMRERNACIAGRRLCEKYGWKIGDRITLKGTIFPGYWEFVIRGIYSGRDSHTNEKQFFFRWDYRYEKLKLTMPQRANQAGIFLIRLTDRNLAAEVSAEIDRTFRNSSAETITETEKSFQMNFIHMSEAVLVIIHLVSVVLLIIMMTVLANTMAMAVRERTSEYAVLKTVGFGGGHILVMILGESLFITMTGCVIGVALSFPFMRLLADLLGSYFPLFVLTEGTVVSSFTASLLVGALSPAVPLYRAISSPVADGLRRIV